MRASQRTALRGNTLELDLVIEQGLKVQDLIEERKAAMLSSKGRVKLPTGRQFAKIAIDELETDKEYGYLLGQDYLLELKIAGTGWKDLNLFKTKADLVLKQLPTVERPSETTLRRWLVKNLQQQPLLTKTMELYDESRANSSKRTSTGFGRGWTAW